MLLYRKSASCCDRAQCRSRLAIKNFRFIFRGKAEKVPVILPNRGPEVNFVVRIFPVEHRRSNLCLCPHLRSETTCQLSPIVNYV